MAYRYKNYQKSGYKKKYGPLAKRARVYGPAAKQLFNDVSYLKTLINSEPHYYVRQASNNFDYNGTVLSLSNVPQGDTNTDRTGFRILPRYMNIKGFVSITSVTTRTDPINIRVMVFRYWGESTDAAPNVAATDVLATTGSQFAPLSNLNDNNVGPKGDRQRRIEVHKSLDLLLDKTGSTPGVVIDCNIQVNGGNSTVKEHIQYRSNATEDPVSGGFYLLFISDTVTATEVHYKFNSKLTFYDN